MLIESWLNLWKTEYSSNLQMLSTNEQLMGLLRLISKGEVACSEKPISFDKCWRLLITSSNIIQSNIHSWDCQMTFSCKILGGFQKLLKKSGTEKDRCFPSFYRVVIHLSSFPHLLLTSSYQPLLTDHNIALSEVHRATGCPDSASDQNWPKRFNSVTIPGWDFRLFLFPFLLTACYKPK